MVVSLPSTTQSWHCLASEIWQNQVITKRCAFLGKWGKKKMLRQIFRANSKSLKPSVSSLFNCHVTGQVGRLDTPSTIHQSLESSPGVKPESQCSRSSLDRSQKVLGSKTRSKSSPGLHRSDPGVVGTVLWTDLLFPQEADFLSWFYKQPLASLVSLFLTTPFQTTAYGTRRVKEVRLVD